jgi:hypothetical protein
MISVERCAQGRLRNAYPVSRHDVELRVEHLQPDSLTAVLSGESDRVLEQDPECRKVVFAAPVGDVEVVAAAERAGFRYVVDVDVPEGSEVISLSLLVREPAHVTRVDMDLDRVPET